MQVGKWVFGGIMGLISLFGLFMASRSNDEAFYWTGLALFLFGIVVIFANIKKSYDAADEGPNSRRTTESGAKQPGS
jgi:membrane-bound ClpP family serine protease